MATHSNPAKGTSWWYWGGGLAVVALIAAALWVWSPLGPWTEGADPSPVILSE